MSALSLGGRPWRRRASWRAGAALLAAAAAAPCLGSAAAPPAAPEPPAVRLELALASRLPAAQAPPALELLLLRRDPPGQEPLRRRLAAAEFPVVLEIGEGAWTIEAKAPGVWAPALNVVLKKDGAPRRAEIQLYPAAAVSGRIEVEKGDTLPSELALELFEPAEKPSPSRPRPPRPSADSLTVRCPVAQGAFECAAPAGLWDLRAGASGHISHYLWNRRLAAGAPASLGTLLYKRGASVAGWVVFEGTLQRSARCRVSLKPLHAAVSSASATTDRALRLATEADERGFFQLEAVPPGAYVLTADVAGFASADFFPLRVLENLETQVEKPLILRPPVSLTVRINPSSDLSQQPWKVQVYKLGQTPGVMDRAGEAKLGPDGAWHLEGLTPGRFRVNLLDAAGSPWASQPVELPLGSPVDFDLDLVEVRGTLRLAGEPLAATIYFGGRTGVPHFRLDSDQRGSFTGYLAREGEYRIEVAAKDPPIARYLPRVDVRRPPGKSVAKLELELPDGRLHGRVTDESDQPVPKATVSVAMADPKRPARSDNVPVNLATGSDGEFTARGLDTGQAMVQARQGQEAESEAAWVQIDDKADSPSLHLVLKKKRQVAGWVLGPSGGVPGAQVIATTSGQQAVTDVAGRFSLSVPASATALDLETLAPGYSLQARHVQLGDDDLRLMVDAEGGTLVLEGVGDMGGVIVQENGVPLILATLRRWAEGNAADPHPGAGRLVIPHIEAGQYQVCRVPLSRARSYMQGDRANLHCAAGVVPPGGELTLRAPAPEPATN